jgi:hypothetical protein
VKIIDNRDAMHRQGWTYFRITGQIDGERILGTGRTPFVYATSKRFSPWLRLRVGDDLELVDTTAGACIYDDSGKLLVRYKAGSFFKGLARPWMGLHIIDTVRRDAAEQEVWFETKYDPGSGNAQVELTIEKVSLTYVIDLKADVIDQITLSKDGTDKGHLRFSYLQDLNSVGSEFRQPRKRGHQGPLQEPLGLLWLVRLAEGSLLK